ncbi:hypothetical protein FDB55_06390 [Clostridium botulinum]|uniref:Uncharacterized protein n=1 Tax=Clostridium botulinum TaxID=1491 RepID=A0A0M1LWF4_CLOBO|nr:hypothetical protein [Clostridium botulinum]ACD52914.1 conserved hypothetical protein [Clostridium botulinum E3 str. Alaska E43]AJF29062.1 hypothetical protein ST13_05010 [Clostridium botulinum]AJF32123.1 hypothetical protein ST12_05010 [Clostridium botulinum]KAI3349253.1 hypothetical protein CIT18_09080 [Clostridium botulinum]KOM87971.1 hypothetical protein ACP51_10395 [Clostridium botulinum]
MYKIYNNNYHKKLNITENDLVKQTILNRIPNKNDIKDLTSIDGIEINEKNENVINTRKAYDAFKDSCSKFGYVETSSGNGSDMSLYYNTIVDMMRDDGIDVPSFIPDGNNNCNFLPFIDKMKEYAKDLSLTNPNFLPDCFSEFCDLFKEKLIQYDCK